MDFVCVRCRDEKRPGRIASASLSLRRSSGGSAGEVSGR